MVFQELHRTQVPLWQHSIIYHVIDATREHLTSKLPKKEESRVLGEANILQIFDITIKGRATRKIAGLRIINGVIKRADRIKVLRQGEVVYTGNSP